MKFSFKPDTLLIYPSFMAITKLIMVRALLFRCDCNSYSFPRQTEREEFRANLPHAIWLSRCVLDINLEYTKFTKVGRDIVENTCRWFYMYVTKCTKSQSTRCNIYIYTHIHFHYKYRYLMYHHPTWKGRVFRCLKNYQALVCNAAVYFPNAHKEGVILPGLFPGGGPRWSAEGGQFLCWSTSRG